MNDAGYTADEMMAVEAARRVDDGTVCFVGIGLPSKAANLARATHAPGCVLIYESGTIGAKPEHLPLSIGDGELAETADVVVSVPEIFRQIPARQSEYAGNRCVQRDHNERESRWSICR